MVLIKLILAHLLGDFVFQPGSWVRSKREKKIASGKLYLHVLVHGAVLFVLLWDLSAWPLILSLMGIHYLIDLLKLYALKKDTATRWFFLDQGLHLVSLFVLFYLFERPDWNFPDIFENEHLWIIVTALVFLIFVAGFFIQKLLQKWTTELQDGKDESLSSAGRYIGILERLFVFVFLLSGQWEGIGFLLAAKSIFRFGDLKEAKDRKLTEYILIGTLLSFGIAGAVGLWVKSLIH